MKSNSKRMPASLTNNSSLAKVGSQGAIWGRSGEDPSRTRGSAIAFAWQRRHDGKGSEISVPLSAPLGYPNGRLAEADASRRSPIRTEIVLPDKQPTSIRARLIDLFQPPTTEIIS